MKKFLVFGCAALLCLSMTACSFGNQNTVLQKEPTTEEKADEGFETSKDVINAYWDAFANVDKSGFSECFPDPDDAKRVDTNISDLVDEQYDHAKSVEDTIDIDLDGIEIEEESYDVDDVENDLAKVYSIDKAKLSTVTVPLKQVGPDGAIYDVDDIYEIVTVKINGSWYISTIKEIDVKVKDTTSTETDVTEAPSVGTTEEITSDQSTTIGTNNETDYSKVTWGATYAPAEDMPGVIVSVTPMVDDYGKYTLIVGVTNTYDTPIDFAGKASAKDDNGNYIGDSYIYFGSIGSGNTSIATIYCPDGKPNGEIQWDELNITEGFSDYVPWTAKWDIQAADSDNLTLSYDVTMEDATFPGDVYGLILDDKGIVIDYFHDYVTDSSLNVSSSTDKYRAGIANLDIADVALFINPTK